MGHSMWNQPISYLSDFAEKQWKYALCYQTKESEVSGQYLKRFVCGVHLNFKCHTPFWHIGISRFICWPFWRPITSLLIMLIRLMCGVFVHRSLYYTIMQAESTILTVWVRGGSPKSNLFFTAKIIFHFLGAPSATSNDHIYFKQDYLLYLGNLLLPKLIWRLWYHWWGFYGGPKTLSGRGDLLEPNIWTPKWPCGHLMILMGFIPDKDIYLFFLLIE